MNTRPEHTPATPRWTTLALLGMAVLGVHLTLLGGGLPSLSATALTSPPSSLTPATPEPHRVVDTAPPAQRAQQPRVTTSTVRWIVQATPVPVPATEPATEPAPKQVVRAAPTQPKQPVEPSPMTWPSESDERATPHAIEGEQVAALTEPAPAAVEEASLPETPAPATSTEIAMRPTQALADQEVPVSQAPSIPVPPQPSAPRPPAHPPASTQLAYDVSGNIKGLNYHASGTLDWTHADGQYSARMEIRLLFLGSRVQTSTGRVDGSGLLPERFSDKSRSERAAHFDHTQKTIRFSNNRPDATLQPGAQDRLSLFMQLAGLLQARPAAYPAGQSIRLQVAGTSDADIWHFRVAEEATLSLPAGSLRTRHLVREPREPRDSRIDIWFAPDLAHLPVRIRITQENGDHVDQQLSRMP